MTQMVRDLHLESEIGIREGTGDFLIHVRAEGYSKG